MLSKLEKIFYKQGFTKIDNFDIPFFKSNIGKCEYYLIYEIKELSKTEIDKILNNYILNINFEKLGELYETQMEKNTSILFTVKTESWELNDSQKKCIFELEEDPHFYKKYVIWYTDDELKNIDKFIDKEELTDSLIDSEMFGNMKKSMKGEINFEEDVSSYSLLTRLFIKLPFLNLKDMYNNQHITNIDKLLEKIDINIKSYTDVYKEIFEANYDYEIPEEEIEKLMADIDEELGVI